MKQLFFATAEQWRNWLARNRNSEKGIWLIFHKKGTGNQALDYSQALDEALCFGWIDSLIKRVDDKRYARQFTPRKKTSRWSKINKKRVQHLITNGRMTAAGYAIIKDAKTSGQWDKPDRPPLAARAPAEFQKALEKNEAARNYFEGLAASYKKQYMMWIALAKRKSTKEQRIKEAIGLLERGQKLGLR